MKHTVEYISAALFITLLLCGCKSKSNDVMSSEAQQTMVYITPTGNCYHREHCSYLSDNKIKIDLSQAAEKYRPCSRCHPPKISNKDKNS